MVDDIRKQESNPAVINSNFVSHVNGKVTNPKKSIPTLLLSLILIAVVAVVAFSSQSLLPFALNDLAISEDLSYQTAATNAAKVANFSYLLSNSQLDNSLVERLKNEHVLVGYLDQNGAFIENNSGNVLNFEDRIITPDGFKTEVYNNQKLYNAFYNATYGNLGNYQDNTAQKVYRKIGVSSSLPVRDTFEEVLHIETISHTSTEANTVRRVEKEDDEGNIYYDYEDSGAPVTESSLSSLQTRISGLTDQDATMNYAAMVNAIEAAIEDHTAEQTAMTYNILIDTVKAGDDARVDINGAMDKLTQDQTYSELNTTTGVIEQKTGAAIDAIGVILNKEDLGVLNLDSYSSDRVLITANNLSGNNLALATNSNIKSANLGETIKSTIVSAPSTLKSFIGRFLTGAIRTPVASVVSAINPVATSLAGQPASGTAFGYRYIRGQFKVSERLAKARGGAVGDSVAVAQYQNQLSTIIAMDNAAKNAANPSNNFIDTFIAKITSKSPLLPSVSAINNQNALAKTGNCATLSAINGEGNAFCSISVTFPVETILNAYSDQNYLNFVNQWTYLDDGVRYIKRDSNSPLYKYLIYYSEQYATPGNSNGTVLANLRGTSPYSINEFVKIFSTATDEEKAIANSSEFINSTSNPKWQSDYQYALTYIILSSVMDQFVMFSENKTAYNNVQFFEGGTSPVLAFLDDYYKENPVDNSYAGYLARATGYSKEDVLAVLEFMQTDAYLAMKTK